MEINELAKDTSLSRICSPGFIARGSPSPESALLSTTPRLRKSECDRGGPSAADALQILLASVA
jgi:hypothetical protein